MLLQIELANVTGNYVEPLPKTTCVDFQVQLLAGLAKYPDPAETRRLGDTTVLLPTMTEQTTQIIDSVDGSLSAPHRCCACSI